MKEKPKITISSLDADRLDDLLELYPENSDLDDELYRAEILDPEHIPGSIVTMNSTVEFRINRSTVETCRTLVYPRDLEVWGGTISILSPVGSSLLGLHVGDEIEWPSPAGGSFNIQVSKILFQPERAGFYYL